MWYIFTINFHYITNIIIFDLYLRSQRGVINFHLEKMYENKQNLLKRGHINFQQKREKEIIKKDDLIIDIN